MKLINEIIDTLSSDTGKLSDALIKTKVLLHKIGHKELVPWVNNELNGLNENADPTVRDDFGRFFNRLVPENEPYYVHTDEGPDDMPAHLKSSILGSTLSLPITHGRFNLGIWQGIYLCEHRNYGGERTLLVTLQGE